MVYDKEEGISFNNRSTVIKCKSEEAMGGIERITKHAVKIVICQTSI